MATRQDFLIGTASAVMPRLIISRAVGRASAAAAQNHRDEYYSQGTFVPLRGEA